MSTRLLVVDDDQQQLRMLARLLTMHKHDLTVLTASDGRDAIEVLESGAVDMVLTDLQMPEMNGLELLAWMTKHQPNVAAYAMTAYPDADAVDRLAELGTTEYFTKPVDLASLFERIDEALAQKTRGHVNNIGLPSFLQLMEMERETCMLSITSERRLGELHLACGELVDARTEHLAGRDAAVEIIAWPSPAITILNAAPPRERTLTEPLGFLIMESIRLKDEADDAPLPNTRAAGQNPEQALSIPTPPHIQGAAVIALEDGRPRVTTGMCEPFARLFQAAIQLFEPSVEEIVLTGPQTWLVAQPLSAAQALAVVAFDVHSGSLVRARAAIKAVTASYRSHVGLE